MTALRVLSEQHPDLLKGTKKETEEDLRAVEVALAVRLPSDVRWLLLECGYGAVHAVPNIQESVDHTMRFRSATGLASKFVVLNDMNDAGVVLLDTSSERGAVIWADWRVAGRLHLGPIKPSEADFFPTFGAWVEQCVSELRDE